MGQKGSSWHVWVELSLPCQGFPGTIAVKAGQNEESSKEDLKDRLFEPVPKNRRSITQGA